MLIVNADDWGRSVGETDSALECFLSGRVTSVTAMVFMADSERAAHLAVTHGIPVGLHLNFNEPFGSPRADALLVQEHRRVMRFLNQGRFAPLFPNLLLRHSLGIVFSRQLDEFVRLYGKAPTHFDGHRHLHLCSPMLVAAPIPEGEKVRRTFSFTVREKGLGNWLYRRALDRWITRRYRTTDRFFALSQQLGTGHVARIAGLSHMAHVELMTHPAVPRERQFLLSEEVEQYWSRSPLGHYGVL